MSKLSYIPGEVPILCHRCGSLDRLGIVQATGRCYNCRASESMERRELAEGRKTRRWKLAEGRKTLAVLLLGAAAAGLTAAVRAAGVIQ